MAMTGAGMGAVLAAAARTAFSAIPQDQPASDAEVDKIWEDAGAAMVAYIQANATVTVTVGSSAGTYPVQ